MVSPFVPKEGTNIIRAYFSEMKTREKYCLRGPGIRYNGEKYKYSRRANRNKEIPRYSISRRSRRSGTDVR